MFDIFKSKNSTNEEKRSEESSNMDNRNELLSIVHQVQEHFNDACCSNDAFEAAKMIGILEFLHAPDLEYYIGYYYFIKRNYEGAIGYLIKLSSSSQLFPCANLLLVLCYIDAGKFEELDDLLASENCSFSPMEKLKFRINCLYNINASKIPEISDRLEKLKLCRVEENCTEAGDYEARFALFHYFSMALVIAGNCINRCAIYKEKYSLSSSELQNNPDVVQIIQAYDKATAILSLSQCIPSIVISSNIGNGITLADVVLYKLDWSKKVEGFFSSDCPHQILKMLFKMQRPEFHPNAYAFECIFSIIEQYIVILQKHPEELNLILQLVDRYFDIIKENYYADDPRATQILGFAYSCILVNGSDRFALKDRIKSLGALFSAYNIDKTVLDISLAGTMSRNAHDLLILAEKSYNCVDKNHTGIDDFSSLSLQYLRVLEMEYTNKLITPLVKSLNSKDFQDLKNYADDFKKRHGDEKYKRIENIFNNDYSCLNNIKIGTKTSMEVGRLRTLLDHLCDYRNKKELFVILLKEKLNGILTDEGMSALYSGEMSRLISNDILLEYRVPGAHIGFLPFSKACEAREYVLANLPILQSWFKK